MSKRETTINDETSLGFGNEAIGTPTGLVEMNERRRIGDEEGVEVEIFEDELVDGALNGGEIQEGFDEEERGERRVFEGEERGEDVRPDVALEVGVDQVPAVQGAAERGGGQVGGGGVELVADKPFFRRQRPPDTVRDHGGWFPLAADPRLD